MVDPLPCTEIQPDRAQAVSKPKGKVFDSHSNKDSGLNLFQVKCLLIKDAQRGSVIS